MRSSGLNSSRGGGRGQRAAGTSAAIHSQRTRKPSHENGAADQSLAEAGAPKAKRLRLLITAGPTREYIDTVRYISNESSGRMGFALAEAAALHGHDVTLIYGPVSLPVPVGVRAVPVISAKEMLSACRRAWPRQHALLMVAAVADYRPTQTEPRKLKKSKTMLRLELEPTEDILATLAQSRRAAQVVLGFALEDHNAQAHAADKLQRKRLDAIVLNSPRAIGAKRNQVQVLVAGGQWQRWPDLDKDVLAERLIGLVQALTVAKSGSGRAATAMAQPQP